MGPGNKINPGDPCVVLTPRDTKRGPHGWPEQGVAIAGIHGLDSSWVELCEMGIAQ